MHELLDVSSETNILARGFQRRRHRPDRGPNFGLRLLWVLRVLRFLRAAVIVRRATAVILRGTPARKLIRPIEKP